MPNEKSMGAFLEIQNTISCLQSALRILYGGGLGIEALPGTLEMAEFHLKWAKKIVKEEGLINLKED